MKNNNEDINLSKLIDEYNEQSEEFNYDDSQEEGIIFVKQGSIDSSSDKCCDKCCWFIFD